MRNARYLTTALAVLAVFSLAAAQVPESREVSLFVGSATLADLKGDISLRSPQGAPVAPQRGLTLPPDSVIETGKGSLLLNLQDGSQVLVNPHSRVLLKSPTQGRGYYLELLLGKIMAQVQKRFGNAPSFKMGTPTAVITVRGTRFSVAVSKKNKTTVDVYEGVVAVAGFGSEERPVLLQPGFWTEVGNPGAVPREPREMYNPKADMEDLPGQGRRNKGEGDNSFSGAWNGVDQHTGSGGEAEGMGSGSGSASPSRSGTELENTGTRTKPPGLP